MEGALRISGICHRVLGTKGSTQTLLNPRFRVSRSPPPTLPSRRSVWEWGILPVHRRMVSNGPACHGREGGPWCHGVATVCPAISTTQHEPVLKQPVRRLALQASQCIPAHARPRGRMKGAKAPRSYLGGVAGLCGDTHTTHCPTASSSRPTLRSPLHHCRMTSTKHASWYGPQLD